MFGSFKLVKYNYYFLITHIYNTYVMKQITIVLFLYYIYFFFFYFLSKCCICPVKNKNFPVIKSSFISFQCHLYRHWQGKDGRSWRGGGLVPWLQKRKIQAWHCSCDHMILIMLHIKILNYFPNHFNKKPFFLELKSSFQSISFQSPRLVDLEIKYCYLIRQTNNRNKSTTQVELALSADHSISANLIDLHRLIVQQKQAVHRYKIWVCMLIKK